MLVFVFESIHTTEQYEIKINPEDYICKDLDYLLDCARMDCMAKIAKESKIFLAEDFHSEFYLKEVKEYKKGGK